MSVDKKGKKLDSDMQLPNPVVKKKMLDRPGLSLIKYRPDNPKRGRVFIKRLKKHFIIRYYQTVFLIVIIGYHANIGMVIVSATTSLVTPPFANQCRIGEK